jgi:hypothetical protein
MVRAITTAAILSAWETAYGLGAAARGVVLLGLAMSHEPVERLLQFSIGQRDAALLNLRGRLFGQQLNALVACPACSEKVELNFRAEDVLVPQPELPPNAEFEWNGGAVKWSIRLPTCGDLLAIEQVASPASRRQELLRRCVRSESDSVAGAELPDGDAQLISHTLAQHDPQADIRFSLECPACQHGWSSRFDIVAFLWQELDVWAQRLLADVHSLAVAYGWSEHDIVAMSPWRRQIYLGMLRR